MQSRLALRLAFMRRRTPVLLVRPANGSTMDVLCNPDLNSKPLITRRFQEAATIAASAVVFAFLIIACAFFGGLR